MPVHSKAQVYALTFLLLSVPDIYYILVIAVRIVDARCQAVTYEEEAQEKEEGKAGANQILKCDASIFWSLPVAGKRSEVVKVEGVDSFESLARYLILKVAIGTDEADDLQSINNLFDFD